MSSANNRDLIRDFHEQWRFLHASMRAFDEGHNSEAKRLAVSIRVFVHDTSRSTSLLTHLGVKDDLWFVASGGGVSPYNVQGTTSLVGQQFASGPERTSIRYVPHRVQDIIEASGGVHPEFVRATDFEDWWGCPVIKDIESQTFSRKDLVLVLANKDGGAHIDDLDANQAALKAGLNYGWTVDAGDGNFLGPVPLSPVEASVRTIATELDLTFFNQPDVLGFEFEGEPYIPAEPDYSAIYGEDEAVFTAYGVEIRHYDDDEEIPDGLKMI